MISLSNSVGGWTIRVIHSLACMISLKNSVGGCTYIANSHATFGPNILSTAALLDRRKLRQFGVCNESVCMQTKLAKLTSLQGMWPGGSGGSFLVLEGGVGVPWTDPQSKFGASVCDSPPKFDGEVAKKPGYDGGEVDDHVCQSGHLDRK